MRVQASEREKRDRPAKWFVQCAGKRSLEPSASNTSPFAAQTYDFEDLIEQRVRRMRNPHSARRITKSIRSLKRTAGTPADRPRRPCGSAALRRLSRESSLQRCRPVHGRFPSFLPLVGITSVLAS